MKGPFCKTCTFLQVANAFVNYHGKEAIQSISTLLMKWKICRIKLKVSLKTFQHSYNSWKNGFWQNLEGVAQKLNLPRPFDVFDGFGGKSKFLCTYNLHIWYKVGSHRVWQLVKIWWWYLKPSLRNSKLTVLSFQSIPQEVIK